MTTDSKQQFMALKKRSTQTQHALDTTHTKLKEMEVELADFLDDYYREVGASFEHLSALKLQLQQVNERCFELPTRSALPPKARARTNIKRDIQSFYHSIAREVHPDSGTTLAEENMALKAEMMKTLNAAYARKSLSELWKIKWELEQYKYAGKLTHRQRLELLQAQQEQMQGALEELRTRENEIRDSAAWQLMRHAELMRVCGQDFIQMVKGRVDRQIAETKQQLISARIKRKYWDHVRMEPANVNAHQKTRAAS